MKTRAEIREGLGKKYARTLKEVDGYDYIPWPDVIRTANDIFDPDGYNIEVLKTWVESIPNAKGEVSNGYAALVRVTVHPSDGGPIVRDGLGFSELLFTQEKEYTDKKTGEVKVIPSRALIDSAIKGCVSRALVRALTLFGEAFGLFLYDKEDTQASTGAAPRSSNGGSSNGDLGYRPSDKQAGILRQAFNFTQEQIDLLPYRLWKPMIDDKFGGKNPKAILTEYGPKLQEAGVFPAAQKKDTLPL